MPMVRNVTVDYAYVLLFRAFVLMFLQEEAASLGPLLRVGYFTTYQ